MKLYPSLRYKDAKAAHQWLQEAFGFEPVALHEDDRGNVAHAEMRWGSDLIMFGTAREDQLRPSHRPGLGVCDLRRSRRVVCPRQGGWCRGHDGTDRPGLRLPRLRRARPRGQPVELRDLRADVAKP